MDFAGVILDTRNDGPTIIRMEIIKVPTFSRMIYQIFISIGTEER